MKPPPVQPTPLQQQLASLYALLLNARELLDENSYATFVEIACDRIGIEAGRLLVGEITREERRPAA